MKVVTRTQIVLILITALIAGAGLACDGFSRISGHVYDASDRPISGAGIVFEEIEDIKSEHVEDFRDIGYTDDTGRFGLGFTHAPLDI